MRVLNVRMLFLVGGPGNAERVDVSDLFANRLASRGLRIDYVIFDQSTGPAWKRTGWRGATAFVVGCSRRTGLKGAIENKLFEILADLRTCWLALTGPYDLIQIRDKFVVAVLALLAARLRGRRFTYWLSYPYAECRILDAQEGRARVPFLSLMGGRIAAWLLYRIIMPRADHVFVQSQQMLRDIAAEGVDPARMSPVPMGVGEALLDKLPEAVRPRTILYLGTLHRVRRLDILIEALEIVLKDFPDARLIYVGDGPTPEDRDFLERTVASRGLESAVEFTGMLPMDEAQGRAMQAAVCVSPFYPTPILRSTSPTKLVEYMALGRPVVANEHPEQTAILAESGAGIRVEWSAESFARAFRTLFSDPEAAEAMGRRGRDYVRAHRTYALIARDVSSQYARLFADSKGARHGD